MFGDRLTTSKSSKLQDIIRISASEYCVGLDRVAPHQLIAASHVDLSTNERSDHVTEAHISLDEQSPSRHSDVSFGENFNGCSICVPCLFR